MADVPVKVTDEEEEGLSWDYQEAKDYQEGKADKSQTPFFGRCELSPVQRIWLCPVLFV